MFQGALPKLPGLASKVPSGHLGLKIGHPRLLFLLNHHHPPPKMTILSYDWCYFPLHTHYLLLKPPWFVGYICRSISAHIILIFAKIFQGSPFFQVDQTNNSSHSQKGVSINGGTSSSLDGWFHGKCQSKMDLKTRGYPYDELEFPPDLSQLIAPPSASCQSIFSPGWSSSIWSSAPWKLRGSPSQHPAAVDSRSWRVAFTSLNRL